MGRQDRAFGLAALLVIATLIATFAGAASLVINQRVASVNKRKRKIKAEFVASAGIEMTLKRLQDNSLLFSPVGRWSSDDDPTTRLSDPGLKYEVLVHNNQSSGTVTAPDGTRILPRHAWIESTPILDGERVEVAAVVKRAAQPQPRFGNALHVLKRIVSLNNVTFAPMAGSPAGSKANVRLEEGAWYTPSTTIDGDLLFPSEDEFPSPWSVFNLTGQSIAEERKYPKLQFRAPPALRTATVQPAPSGGLLPPGRYGRVQFSSDVTLQAGDYYFEALELRDDVDLDLSPLVTPANSTRVYISNDLIIGDRSEVNTGGVAAELAFYGTDTGDVWWDHEIVFGNDSESTCVIATGLLWTLKTYPPPTNVTLNGSMVIGFPWRIENLRINYDPSLANMVIPAETEWVIVSNGEG